VASQTVDCNAGEVATGGGVVFRTFTNFSALRIIESKPNPADANNVPRGWTVQVVSTVNQTYSFNVLAICAVQSV
jgi:hypothetical protein